MSMRKNRKSYPPAEIVGFLRQNMLEKIPVSELADKFGFHPTLFYRWQKQFFENGATAFERAGNGRKDSQVKNLERQNAHLQTKLTHKDEVIAELVEHNISLKKNLGPA